MASHHDNKYSITTRSYSPSEVVKFFVENIPAQNKGLALDLGSGNGRNARYLAGIGGYQKVIGIELSDVGIKLANSLTASQI